MPTVEQLERRMNKAAERQIQRFEMLEKRLASLECDGMGELFRELVEMHRRVDALEREGARMRRKRPSRKSHKKR